MASFPIPTSAAEATFFNNGQIWVHQSLQFGDNAIPAGILSSPGIGGGIVNVGTITIDTGYVAPSLRSRATLPDLTALAGDTAPASVNSMLFWSGVVSACAAGGIAVEFGVP